MDIQTINELVEQYGKNWKFIGHLTSENSEKIRSIYRRNGGRVEGESSFDYEKLSSIKIAFPTDEHVPFQDKMAQSVAKLIVNDFKPDVLIRGSDGIDFYSISDFDTSPDRSNRLQQEIDEWQRNEREWIDVAPNAE